MKNLVFVFIVCFGAINGLKSQVIDFEEFDTEGQSVNTLCADDECCVTFSLGDKQTLQPTTDRPVIAKLGSPGIAFYVNLQLARTEPDCNVNQSTNRDMPLPNQDLGCTFLTQSTGGLEDINSIRPLVIDYHQPVSQASGEIIDIDGGPANREIWTIRAYENNGGTYQQVHQEVISAGDPNTGDGVATYFEVDLGSQTFDRIVLEYTGTKEDGIGLAFDNFRACSVDPSQSTCCEGDNLIDNDIFAPEWGQEPIFTSEYDGVSEDEMRPGTYSLTNTNGITEACDSWNVECMESNFMAVNGLTNGNGEHTVLSVPVEIPEEGTYSFCVDLKHLANCCFDEDPPELEINIGSLLSEQVSVNTNPENGCNWMTFSRQIEVVGGMTTYIEFKLDGNPYRDGNDLAIGNLRLVPLPDVPSNQLSFTTQASENGDPQDNFYNITATPDESLEEGCDYSWEVCEIDPQTDDCIGNVMTGDGSSGWNEITDFPGYNGVTPGEFEYGTHYKIRRYVDCPCKVEGQWTARIYHGPESLLLENFSNDPQELQQYIERIEERDNTSLILDIKESSMEKNIKVFPNPSKGTFTIEMSDSYSGKADIEIRGINGQLIHRDEIQFDSGLSEEIQFPRDIANALYFIKIQRDGRTESTPHPIHLLR